MDVNNPRVQIVDMTIVLRNKVLRVRARRQIGAGTVLYGPSFTNGMSLLVEESLDVTLEIQLVVDGKIIFTDACEETGMEVVGNMKVLQNRV